MEIQITEKDYKTIHNIASLMQVPAQDFFTGLLRKGLADYCEEDGTFNPKTGTFYESYGPGHPMESKGKCVVLHKQQVSMFECYRIFHDGQMKLVHISQVKIN